MKKLFAFAVAAALCLLCACEKAEMPPEETIASTTTEAITTDNYDFSRLTLYYAPGPWQDAYAAFLREPTNYAEDEPYSAYAFLLADLNNDDIPELILAYGDDVSGGGNFANIYDLQNGKVKIIGRQIDTYYKLLHPSVDPSFPGVFAYGGRSSTFQCNYWTIKDHTFKETPIWSEAPDFEDGSQITKELTDNKQLLAQAREAVSLSPYVFRDQ